MGARFFLADVQLYVSDCLSNRYNNKPIHALLLILFQNGK